MAFKASEVFIEELDTDIHRQGSLIEFSGAAEDLQDGILPNAKLAWTSSRDGRLGTGPELFLTKLSVGTHVITLTATNSAGISTSESTSITVVAGTGEVTVASVTNAASGVTGAVAPGELITIKGAGLGPVAGVSFHLDSKSHLVEHTLSGTRVLIGGFEAPVTYVSATQINVIVPYEVAGQTRIALEVQYQGVPSAQTALTVANSAPGVFTLNATGTGQAIAANQDGTFNGGTNAAAKGSFVTLYITGGGITNPHGSTGSVSGDALRTLGQNVTVTVGGQSAVVSFAGAAPRLVDGVNQLNIQLAENAANGPAQAVIITLAGTGSPCTATIAVK